MKITGEPVKKVDPNDTTNIPNTTNIPLRSKKKREVEISNIKFMRQKGINQLKSAAEAVLF